MKKVHVVTTTKGQTYDPQGTVINKAAKQLGIKNITDVKAGRHFLLIFEESATEEQIKEATSQAAEKLLHNNIIEDYEVIDYHIGNFT